MAVAAILPVNISSHLPIGRLVVMIIEKFNSEKGMPKEAYEIVISTYLNELSTAPYCEPQEFRKRFIPADEDLY